MSGASTMPRRLLAIAARGPDGAMLGAMSPAQREALAALLEEVERALDDGQTIVDEAIDEVPAAAERRALRRLAFDAAASLARDAAASAVSGDDGCAIRLIAHGRSEERARAAYVLRGDAGSRRLSTARCADDERRLALALLARLETPTPNGARGDAEDLARDGASSGQVADAIDPEAPQRAAVHASCTSRLLVITGGPGTGKTRTIARIVAARCADAPAPAAPGMGMRAPRVQVMAPTGRAAARLREQLDAELQSAPGVVVSTIHAALRWRPIPGAPFAHTASNPLAADLVIVDECSMVDLGLMRRLVEAVPPSATLILVGDADQLASIESGSVFADLCAAPALRSRRIRLEHNYRTQGDPNAAWLAAMVAAVRAGDADRVVDSLRDAGALLEPGHAPNDRTRLAVEAATIEYQAILDRTKDDSLAAFDALRRFRVLCATRRGDGGIEPIAQRLDERLDGGLMRRGRQVMLLVNDFDSGLANGDMGVMIEQGVVVGRREDGSPRIVARASLPEHAPAWAISIHKSQGSEYEQVLVVLPDPESPILSRQLLYTALTRSRGQVRVIGSEASVRAAVQRTVQRASGLLDELRRDD